MTKPLGTKLISAHGSMRSLIGEIIHTTAGNIALRIGRELTTGGWEQTEYVVLTPAERDALVARLTAAE